MALRTPLYDWHLAHKAVMVDFGGWDMPVRYSTITDEHAAVRSSCGLFDVSHMARFSFSGSGVLDFIQHVWTNNAATMKDNQVRYGLLCNDRGGIRDDILVYKYPYGWSMVVNASNRPKILAWFAEHMSGRDVQLDDRTEATAMLAVQGPKALEVCSGLFDADLAAIKYYFAAPTRYAGNPCVVSRTGYTGEDGFEVMLKADLAAKLADELVARGATPAGLGARDTLRLEAAMPLYGHELDEDTDPIQAGLSWAVKLDKGDFVGKKAITERMKDEKRTVRVGLEVEGRRAAREGAIVHRPGTGADAVGKVTSGTITPTLGKAVAMAYVAPEVSAVGTVLDVEVGKTRTAAKVVPLPFYSRKKL